MHITVSWITKTNVPLYIPSNVVLMRELALLWSQKTYCSFEPECIILCFYVFSSHISLGSFQHVLQPWGKKCSHSSASQKEFNTTWIYGCNFRKQTWKTNILTHLLIYSCLISRGWALSTEYLSWGTLLSIHNFKLFQIYLLLKAYSYSMFSG